ncbi:MAG: hypothetical protein ACJ8AI_01925 [Rhodopila sp.]
MLRLVADISAALAALDEEAAAALAPERDMRAVVLDDNVTITLAVFSSDRQSAAATLNPVAAIRQPGNCSPRECGGYDQDGREMMPNGRTVRQTRAPWPVFMSEPPIFSKTGGNPRGKRFDTSDKMIMPDRNIFMRRHRPGRPRRRLLSRPFRRGSRAASEDPGRQNKTAGDA